MRRTLDHMTELLIASATIADRLAAALPTDVEYASARLVDERTERLSVRRHQLEPIHLDVDTGVMISIWQRGGLGYAATADLSDAGLAAAVERARYWADVTAGAMVAATAPPDHPTGTYRSPVEIGWETMPLEDRIDLLHQQSRHLGIDERIVDWSAGLVRRDVDQLLVTSGGGRVEQRFRFVYPRLRGHGERGRQHPDPHVRRHRVLRSGRRRGARPVRLRRRGAAHRGRGARAARRAELPDRRRWTCCSRPTR